MKRTAILCGLLGLMAGCDNDTSLPPYTATIFLEDFEEVQNGAPLDVAGWTTFNPEGNTSWHGEVYSGNGYAAIETGNVPVTIWLVSPAINLGQKQRTLSFRSAQHHLTPESSLQVYIATDFAGNPETAGWTPLEALTPHIDSQWYNFIASGDISLESYTGVIHIGFKIAIESQGAYFIDNVKVY